MSPLTPARTAHFVLLIAAVAAGADKTPTYENGTITKNFSSAAKFYELKGPVTSYRINNCGDFQTGQAVDYRVNDVKIYIRGEGSKEYKCSVERKWATNPDQTPPGPKYQKGTITGWASRVTTTAGGGGTGIIMNSRNRTRIYELKGADLIYQIANCGSFQAGEFTPGQTVDYRVDVGAKRIYILRDNGKEYSCVTEGVRTSEGAKADAPANSVPSTPH